MYKFQCLANNKIIEEGRNSMKSFCIKTNNSCIVNYLINSIEHINQDNIFFSYKEFSLYKNIIVHYTGEFIDDFITNISDILSSCIINFYEKNIIKRILHSEYFYFSDSDLNNILELSLSNLPEERKVILNSCIDSYLNSHKSILLIGFVNFRLKPYVTILNNSISDIINDFVVQKEYYEFVSLLKLYIKSQDSTNKTIHLLYSKFKTLLLDENKSIIDIASEKILNNKYFSDISFSTNDYILNALLTILPSKIFIHLIDTTIDDFIITLQLIFENKVFICTNCNICQIYKNTNYLKPQKDL